MPVFTPGATYTTGDTFIPVSDQPAAPIVKSGFSFPLPIDPIRLVAGVLARWPWIVIGMMIFGGLGAAAGLYINKPTFTVTSSLIKKRVPQTVRISDDGQAFRPGDLNDATLLATLLTTEAMDRTIERKINHLTTNQALGLVESTQKKGTDIFYITYHSPISAKDAVDFSNAWAEEINNYTQRLQQAEARAVRQILQREVSSLEKQLSNINMQLLEFSKQHEFFGGDTQIAAAISTVRDLDLKLQEARVSMAARSEKLETLTEQLRRQSPLESQLKQAREQIAELRATYTDINPLVQAKLQNIEYLENQVKELAQKKDVNLEVYTGTPLGNQIYMEIITLKNEQQELSKQIESYEILSKQARERLHEFPALVTGYDALLKERDTILGGISLMGNRLKEAEIFASSAPGYWQIFQPADIRAVKNGSMIQKPLLLGAAGSFGGAILAIMLCLLLTHRSSRRSVLECCVATKAPLLATFPLGDDEAYRKAVSDFWINTLSPRLNQKSRILFWNTALEIPEERKFWETLASVTEQDGVKQLVVQDLSLDALWQDTLRPMTLLWNQDNSDLGKRILRASGLPTAEHRKSLETVEFWMTPVVSEKDSLSKVLASQSTTNAYLPKCNGTLVLLTPPKGNIRRLGDIASAFITQRFS